MTTRRELMAGVLSTAIAQGQSHGVARYVRFRRGSVVSYGLLEGDRVRALSGELFSLLGQTDNTYRLDQVQLLCPCEPPKIMAVGLNYKSHLGDRPAPKNPEIFYKPVSALQDPGRPIVIPKDARNVHYEGELVIVIGRRARNVTPQQAREVIFGVTCGNDVSERDWQNGPNKDMQWWRAKGADTFAPLGPAIVRGIDYGNLMLQTRVNGKIVQKQRTSDLIFDCPTIVSFLSRYITLVPGDVIYTGTPGATSALKPGDVVEVEIEHIGVLRNPVVAG